MRPDKEPMWDPGFDPERTLTVASLGKLHWTYPSRHTWANWFQHRVIPVPIEDWPIDLDEWRLGHWCTVHTRLDIRFQPELSFVQGRWREFSSPGEWVRLQYRTAVQEKVEQIFDALPPEIWLNPHEVRLESFIEGEIEEFLTLNSIQSRCRCSIRFTFVDAEPDLTRDVTINPAHLEVISALRARLHAEHMRLERERFEQIAEANRVKIEQQVKIIEMLRLETATLDLRQEEETRKVRAEMALQEMAAREKLDSEMRMGLEQIQQENKLRQARFESELSERNSRATALNAVEQHLHREIEFLTLERQRLLLEGEIQETRLARLKGWNTQPAT